MDFRSVSTDDIVVIEEFPTNQPRVKNVVFLEQNRQYFIKYSGILYDDFNFNKTFFPTTEFEKLKQYVHEVNTKLVHAHLLSYSNIFFYSNCILLKHEFSLNTLHNVMYEKECPSDIVLTWPLKYQIIKEMFSAMSFLHEKNELHKRINLKNIHLFETEDGRIISKLGGFGLHYELDEKNNLIYFRHFVSSCILYSSVEKINSEISQISCYDLLLNELEYVAPEILNYHRNYNYQDIYCPPYTTESDIYSFAIVINEIFTETMPFIEITQQEGLLMDKFVFYICNRDIRPIIFDPKTESESYLNSLVQNCWKTNKNTRLNTTQINCVIEHVVNNSLLFSQNERNVEQENKKTTQKSILSLHEQQQRNYKKPKKSVLRGLRNFVQRYFV